MPSLLLLTVLFLLAILLFSHSRGFEAHSWGTSVPCSQLPLLFSTQAARQAPSIAPRYRKKQWLPSRYTAVQKVVLGWPQRASWQWQSNGHSQSDYSGEIQTVLFWVTTLPPAGGLSSLHSLPWVKAQHSALSF